MSNNGYNSKVVLVDENTHTPLRVESNGGIAVNLQDQTSTPLDLYFVQAKAAPTALVSTFDQDATIATVASATGMVVGDYFGVFNTASNRSYFAQILAINSTAITLDTPSDFDFQIDDTAAVFTRDLNVDGSSTSEVFSVKVGAGATESVDITRIMIHILDATAMDDSKFGGIAALTNGIILRRTNGEVRNIWNVKSNADFGLLAYDKSYDDKAPAGFFGMSVRYTFAGQSKHGVAVRLDPGDSLDLIIQDDLTDLDEFRIIAQGHLVTD